jgi:opacity protein-like surface antigen
MNKMIRATLLGSAMMMAMATASHAADPYSPPPVAETPQDYAKMGWYLRGDIGWSFLEWSGGADDDALALGGGVGYQFNDYLRSDLRLDWAGDYSIGGGDDMSVTTVLGNLYFDLPTGTMITPYVGGGIGYGWTSVDGAADDGDGLAWSLSAGASVDLSEAMSIDIGYRFRDVMVSGENPQEHQIMTGLRFKF